VAEWLQIAQRSQWRAYRNFFPSPSLFLMVSSLTPYDLPFPPKWGSICPQYTRMAISLQRVIRSTSCLVLGWGFLGRRIEPRYLRFEQIQDGGRRHVGKISNDHISATGRPIHFMFCSRVGFSGTADGAISGSNNTKMAAAAILEKFQMAISPQPVVRSTSCLVIGWDFRLRRI